EVAPPIGSDHQCVGLLEEFFESTQGRSVAAVVTLDEGSPLGVDSLFSLHARKPCRDRGSSRCRCRTLSRSGLSFQFSSRFTPFARPPNRGCPRADRRNPLP